MSLLRLLTAGKSLVGLKDTGSRYNVPRRGLLPQFSAKKNPFRASTRPEFNQSTTLKNVSEGQSANRAAADSENPGEPALSGRAAVPLRESSLPIAPAVSIPQKTADKRELPGSRGFRWIASLPWMRPKVEKPAIPRLTKSMVQGELSLDAVRVVRNDLSDTDLEIVPAKRTEAIVEPKTACPTVPVAALRQNTWDQVAGRIVGAGKS
jgi:hypothetical protein